jgi:hypothetical protein
MSRHNNAAMKLNMHASPEDSMRSVRNGAWAAVILFVGAISTNAADPPQPVPNELPRSWSLEEIALQMPPYETPGRVYVLAWSIIEDERPLRVESCLALKVLADGRHSFAHLYRRPDQPASGWQIAMTHVAGDTPVTRPGRMVHHTRRFEKQPTNAQVYAALKLDELNWKFELANDWRFVGCGICEQSWLAAIGEKPTRFFGK